LQAQRGGKASPQLTAAPEREGGMHRSARRDPLALMITAMLLGVIAGTSVGLLQGAGPGPGAAPAQAATAAPPSSTRAAAPHSAASSSRSGGSAPAEQRLNVPRRQLDRAKAGKPEHKEPGHSGKRGNGEGDGHGKGKDKQAHGK
jgi:hypothetical protein